MEPGRLSGGEGFCRLQDGAASPSAPPLGGTRVHEALVEHFVGGRSDRCHRLHPRAGLTGHAGSRARTLRWPLCSSGPIWDRSLPAFDEFRFRRGRVNTFNFTSHAITDHGAENDVIAQWTSMASSHSFLPYFLCFLGDLSSAAREKKQLSERRTFCHDFSSCDSALR